MIIAELCEQAGMPPGVINVYAFPTLAPAQYCRAERSRVHGSAPTVNRICDHPAIKAISFVGGDNAGTHIYERCVTRVCQIACRDAGLIYVRATPLGKRVQANLGAKNHAVIMPDGTLKPLFI